MRRRDEARRMNKERLEGGGEGEYDSNSKMGVDESTEGVEEEKCYDSWHDMAGSTEWREDSE